MRELGFLGAFAIVEIGHLPPPCLHRPRWRPRAKASALPRRGRSAGNACGTDRSRTRTGPGTAWSRSGFRDRCGSGRSAATSISRSIASCGRATVSMPFLKALLAKISEKLGAITQVTPMSSRPRRRVRGSIRSRNCHPRSGSARPQRSGSSKTLPGSLRTASNAPLAKAVAADGLEPVRGNDDVGIDVLAPERNGAAFDLLDRLHQSVSGG
jgi:hypothetical protein